MSLRHRAIVRVLIVLCLLGSVCRGGETATIASWNIEHLGSENSRSSLGKGVAQDPSDLARYIAAGKPDILCLVEIDDDDGLPDQRTNKTLDATFAKLNHSGQAQWKYLVLPNRNPKDTTQLCAVAWNEKRVRREGEPWRIELAENPAEPVHTWDRHPHAMKFALSTEAGKTDIVVIPIHMKANSRTTNVVQARAQREREAKQLVAALPAVRSHFNSDKDIVLLGDFNILQGHEPAMEQYLQAGLIDLNYSDTPTTWKGPAPFDRILIPEGQKEFEEAELDVVEPTKKLTARLRKSEEDDHLEPAELHRKYLSDHCMVRITVKLMEDDD